MAIKLIRLFTGADGQSHFEVGKIEWDLVEAVNAVSKSEPVHNISFEETKAGANLEWHNAAVVVFIHSVAEKGPSRKPNPSAQPFGRWLIAAPLPFHRSLGYRTFLLPLVKRLKPNQAMATLKMMSALIAPAT